MTVRLVTADDLCTGAAAVLTAGLGPLIVALGLDEVPDGEPAGRKPFEVPTTWTQVPTLEALQTARFPAGAITSTGIVPGTIRETRTGIDATFRVRIGVFDRGGDYNATANRARTWGALVRGVLLANRTLGGIGSALRLVNESYRQIGQVTAARTLSGAVIEVDVDVRNISDLSGLTTPDPLVLSTDSVVTVHPPHQE